MRYHGRVSDRNRFLQITACALLVRGLILLVWTSRYPWGDGLFYAAIAEQGYRFGIAHDYLLLFPPGYSLAALLLRPFGSITFALGTVSFLCGALVPGVVFLVTSRVVTAREAFHTGLWTACSPLLAGLSAEFLADAQFMLLVWLQVLVVLAILKQPSKKGYILFGVFSSLAFLTKPEGLLLAGVLGMVIFFNALVRKAALRKATFNLSLSAAVGLALCMPYLLWLHQETGQWLLSGKAPLNVMHAAAKQEITDHQEELERVYREGFRLTDDGKFAFLTQAPSLSSVLLKNPGAAMRVYGRNWQNAWQLCGWRTLVLGWFAALGCLELFRRVRFRKKRPALPWLVLFAPVALLILPPVFVSMYQPSFHPARLFAPALPVWIVLGVLGIRILLRFIHTNVSSQARYRISGGVIAIILLLSLGFCFRDARSLERQTAQNYRILQLRTRALSRWIEHNLPPDAVIASTSLSDDVFLARRSVWLPHESNIQRLEDYLLDRNVQAVISDHGGGVYSPGFYRLTPERYVRDNDFDTSKGITIYRREAG